MSLKRLNIAQNKRLEKLEDMLRKSVAKADVGAAKAIALDIQEILRPFGYETRLMQVKNWLYEAGIEAGEYAFAIDGLIAVKLKTNKNTRVHLEATTLLAIAYLRNNDLEKAKPEIRNVLINDKAIKSENKRLEFRKAIIERFDEEVALYSMRGSGNEILDPAEIETHAKLISESESENQILTQIGKNVPQSVINSILSIDSFS
jgi:hypothetical protein